MLPAAAVNRPMLPKADHATERIRQCSQYPNLDREEYFFSYAKRWLRLFPYSSKLSAPGATIQQKMAIRFGASPFDSLDHGLRRYAEGMLERRRLRAGDHFCKKDDRHCGIYWIRSGIMLMYNQNDDGAYEAAGPFYAGIWCAPSITAGFHLAASQAVVATELDVLPARATRELKRIPEFADLFTRWAVEDFHIILRAGSEINAAGAEDKILAYMRHAMLVAQHDPDADPRVVHGEIAWPFSIARLARFLNLSRPYVSKIVGQLTEEGRIRIENGRLTIFPQPKALYAAPAGQFTDMPSPAGR